MSKLLLDSPKETPSFDSKCSSQFIEPETHCIKLTKNDFVKFEGDQFLEVLSASDKVSFEQFCASWNDLPEDTYMSDGGRYRLRRHAVFSANKSGLEVRPKPHQPHYQTTHFNTLNGGLQRYFEPIKEDICDCKIMRSILNFGARTFGTLSPLNEWHIEVHQFRILAGDDQGKPTPEGMHQDGVDYVLMTLIQRSNIVGGETTVQNLEGNEVAKFTLTNPMESIMINDLRVAHGVTPILKADSALSGHRDMLVITYKRA